MREKLTAKQAAFVREYLIDLCAAKAAIRAGYSAKRADALGYENLRKPEVAAAIQSAMKERAERTEITADRVLQEIGRLAFADIRSVFDEAGHLLPVHMLPPEVAASIASIEVVTSRVPGGEPTDVEYTSKIKFWDKRASLDMLGRHLKMFTDKVEVSGADGGPLQLSVVERAARISSILEAARARSHQNG